MNILYRTLRIIALIILKPYFSLTVKGKENIPPRGGVIIASNHLSFLDPVVLGMASYRILSFMARADLFQIPIFGELIRNLNAFPLRRTGIDPYAMKEAINKLKRGEALIIFPEGQRSRDGRLQKGHSGCIWIAQKANVPIIPTRIYGTEKAMPVDSWLIRPYPIKVIFGKLYNPEGKDLDKATEDLMRLICEL